MTVDGVRRELPARKAKALLCRLVAAAGVQPRDSLAQLLWPDSDLTAARHSLRQALTDLRRTFADTAARITASGSEVGVEIPASDVDLSEFRQLAGSAEPDDWERALTLYRGELLEGFDVRTDTFEAWLEDERRALCRQALRLCRALADHHDDDAERAIGWMRRLLALDPLDEAAHRELMQLYIVGGQDGAAIKQYLHCRALLERELGIAPEPATTELYRSLLANRSGAAPAGHALAATATSAPAAVPAAMPAVAPVGFDTGRSLRPAVLLALCVRLDEPDPERADALWRAIVGDVRQLTRSYRGTLLETGHGRLICGFGLERVRGTEADRACLAALELVAMQPRLRAGLASGQVLFGAGDRSVAGRPADEADDLCRRAEPGEIWLTEAVVTAARVPLAVLPAEPGVARLLPAAQLPQRPRAGAVSADEAPAMVGRTLELRQFMAGLDACRDGGGGCTILVRGRAGIGKSRLLEECCALARGEGFRVHHAQAFDFGTARGHEVLGQLARQLLRFEDSQSPTADELQRRLPAPAVPFLSDMLGLPLVAADEAQLASLAPFERMERRAAALTELLRGAARGDPLLLVVDDLHWADALTLAVLPRLARALVEEPVVLLLTSRVAGEALDPDWRGAMGGAPLVTLDLQPLRTADAERLAGAFGADGAQIARIVARAAGNPLFLEQLARCADIAGELPHSIQSLAVAQLEALPTEHQEWLRAASVLGQHFGADALGALRTDDGCAAAAVAETMAAALACAQDSGLIHRDGDAWYFHHALIRDGIYQNLRAGVRRRYHRRAADWYAPRSLSLAAQHLDLAEDPGAADLLLAAAEAEVDHHRLAGALPLLERLLARAPEHGPGLLLQGRVDLLMGDARRALHRFERCLAGAGSAPLRGPALVGLGMALNQLDASRRAIPVLREAVAQPAADDAFLSDAYLQLGNALFPVGLIDECLAAHTRALEHALRAGSTLQQARAEGGLGDAHYQRGAMRTAFDHFDRCVRLGEAHGYRSVVPANLAMRGVARAFGNEFDAGIADGERALALARETSNPRQQVLAHNILATISVFTDRCEYGMQHAQRTLELGRAMGSRRFVIDGLAEIGQLQWCMGEQAAARETLEQAWQLAADDLLPFAGAYVRGLQSLCAASADERRALLRSGEALLSGGAVSHCHLMFYLAAMETTLLHGETAQALRYADGLESYTAVEPLPLADFFIRRARCLAGGAARGTTDRPALLDEARRCGLLLGARLLG